MKNSIWLGNASLFSRTGWRPYLKVNNYSFRQNNFQISRHRHFNSLLPTGQQVSHEQIVCFIKPISLSSSLACSLLAFWINKVHCFDWGFISLIKTNKVIKNKKQKKSIMLLRPPSSNTLFLFSCHSRVIFCDSSKWTVASLKKQIF